MNNKASEESPPLQYIILDTNIIQYTGRMPSAPEFLKYLVELVGRGFGLAISEMSVHEILRNTSVKQENELLKFLGNFNRYYILEQVLIGSAQLYTLYRNEESLKANMDMGDIIIATTSILTNSLILTRNRGDFPYPFFYEAEVRTLYFSKSVGHTEAYTVCLLRPNFEFISRKFAQRQ